MRTLTKPSGNFNIWTSCLYKGNIIYCPRTLPNSVLGTPSILLLLSSVWVVLRPLSLRVSRLSLLVYSSALVEIPSCWHFMRTRFNSSILLRNLFGRLWALPELLFSLFTDRRTLDSFHSSQNSLPI